MCAISGRDEDHREDGGEQCDAGVGQRVNAWEACLLVDRIDCFGLLLRGDLRRQVWARAGGGVG